MVLSDKLKRKATKALYLCASMVLPFSKYHGAGNDFILINGQQIDFPLHDDALISELCHRQFGIGADGLMVLIPSEKSDFTLHYFNADGKLGSLCGNGSRCAVAFAQKQGWLKGDFCRFEAADGLHQAWLFEDGRIKISMNNVDKVMQLGNEKWFAFTGSPHVIVWTQDIETVDVFEQGGQIRHDPVFGPKGTNASFAKWNSDGNYIELRTFERGVEAETLSCGTGAVAAAIIAFASQLTDQTNLAVQYPGGVLEVAFENHKGYFKNVFLTGPVRRVFAGVWGND